jgi:hypothetical protein
MMKRTLMLLVLIGLLLFTSQAAAMSSTHYRLDWFTPLTTGGGGTASSAHYAVNYTIGQTAPQASVSGHYQAGLGYWAGIVSYRLYLPLVLK